MSGVPPFVLPGPRAALVLGAVAAALALAAWWPPAFGLAFLLAAAAGGACIADLAFGPRAGELGLTRRAPDRLMLRRAGALHYDVTNRGRAALRVAILEPEPAGIAFEADIVQVDVPAGGSASVSRVVHPTDRGDAVFGMVFLRVENRVGLLRRRLAVTLPATVRIYPDLSAIERHGRLGFPSRALENGLRRLRRRGTGSELAGVREYAPGDAFRDVAWKASAHRGRLMVVEREVEHSQPIMLALDCGRLMWPRIGAQRKLDYALGAALSVAAIAQRADDRIGCYAFAGAPLASVPPGRGTAHVEALTRGLYRLQPRLEEPDYERAAAEIRRRCPRRTLVVMLTDILDPLASADLLAALVTLAPRHLVLCVLMNDGVLAETAATLPANASQAYRTAVALDLGAERERAVASLRDRGILIVDVPAPRLSVAAIDAYLGIKARGAL